MVDALNRARENLTNAHYTGPVVIVNTVPAVTDNPTLYENSDCALANCHASSIPTQLQQIPALLPKARSQTYSKLARTRKLLSWSPAGQSRVTPTVKLYRVLPTKRRHFLLSKTISVTALPSSPPLMAAGRPIPLAPAMPSSIGASYRASAMLERSTDTYPDLPA